MTLDDIKIAVMQLNDNDKKRVLLEVVPGIWSAATVDRACLDKMKELVDEAVEKEYIDQHMGSV